MEGDRLLTVQEVAERLRINPETVRRWLRQGKLEGVMLGGDRAGYRIAGIPARLARCHVEQEKTQ